MLTLGVLAAIWLLTVGLVWAIRGILTPANTRVTGPVQEPERLGNTR